MDKYSLAGLLLLSGPSLQLTKNKGGEKTPKLYLWDWAEIEEAGPRFENFVAGHLLKYCHFLEDTQGDKMELRFIKDIYGREVDFVVIKNKKPLFAVECKTGEKISLLISAILENALLSRNFIKFTLALKIIKTGTVEFYHSKHFAD